MFFHHIIIALWARALGLHVKYCGVLPRHGQKKNCTRDAIIRNNSDFRIFIYVFNIQPANDLIVSYQMTN